MNRLRLVFAGSPQAAVPSLIDLAASRHDVAAVITRKDSPQGRRRQLAPTAVASAAVDAGIPVLRANRLSAEISDRVAELEPDLGVIVAYGALVREPLLSTPRLGWINLHFSSLPRWRGAAPVQRAIMAGDDTTGAAVFQLVAELDAGDVYGSVTEPIGRMQTAGHLLETLSHSGAALLLRVVDQLAEGAAVPTPQVGVVTYAPKLSLDDGRIDWSRAAERVHDTIRGVTPEPGAHTLVGGDRLKVLVAAIARDAARMPPAQVSLDGTRLLVGTLTDPIELLAVHPAGRKAMSAADWWRGRPARAETMAT